MDASYEHLEKTPRPGVNQQRERWARERRPGAYLSRDVNGTNPGHGYIRVAMVADEQELQRGLIALRDCIYV